MGFGFLNLGTVNMFISFGRLDSRIQIQLRYYVQHIWTFTILFTLLFFMLFMIQAYTYSYQEHTRRPLSCSHITSNFVFTLSLISIVDYRFVQTMSEAESAIFYRNTMCCCPWFFIYNLYCFSKCFTLLLRLFILAIFLFFYSVFLYIFIHPVWGNLGGFFLFPCRHLTGRGGRVSQSDTA